ncbi:hypothetical protein BDN72DRAFT_413553 [Pluteus cervinus]|uniref:Uncharacterized protein n=1 Tax=Pluteus cervinus TaxID=181527 RepID=A0ACD3A7V4_9AGAR|nr:hypothetical protein BDN72DRAFT_413553 [Pluteus cervinus]
MELVASLPPELWMRIFKFLSPTDIRVLLQVHRIFRPFCAAQVWNTITLCSLKQKDLEKAQEIIWTASNSPRPDPYGLARRSVHTDEPLVPRSADMDQSS